ncbi:MAG: prolipoprotein diacylglyceryl transferase [Atopobiaceae bacterium]|nr:prolipoprotein diacylglyceryl transferase [Atopobiaceae bacterium]
MWLNDLYHSLNPVALTLGPLTIRWYGLAYLFGFIFCGIIMYRTGRRWRLNLTADDVVTLMTGIACGVIIGGRLGYVLFYGKGYYLQHPLSIFMLNEGGMSFHGGMIGAILGAYISHAGISTSFGTLCDLVAIGAPVGLFLGRCANFINGELWGKETALPWGVMFDDAGGGAVFRHPTQLYEALLEGLLLFCVQYVLSLKRPPRYQGTFVGVFMLLYGCFRFLIEFVRLPDAHMGYLAWGWLTMGQVLSLPLILAGVVMLVIANKRKVPQH